jgi:hypothetical protein
MAQDSVLPRSKLKVQMPPGAATPPSGVYEQVGPTLMPISDRAYREIWKNLSEPGFEHVTVGENGEIHLGRVRLIRLQSPGAGSPEIGTGGRGHRGGQIPSRSRGRANRAAAHAQNFFPPN